MTDRRRRAGLAASALLVLVVATPGVASAIRTQTPEKPPVVVSEGDIVKVDGVPLGCVVRRQDGEPALDCRRVGELRGTYGTIVTTKRAMVVRFTDGKTAKVVFSARHRTTRTHTCTGGT